ncbi:MAG TPA: Eco29kI family restriction endonuclease, partial [Anaerolineales bacterium]|nr:Eco29kI family restriction endonuclease [Anaerolineales bacterium]
VYAGKALQTKLGRRLSEHYRKIAGRRNIEVGDITCRFLVIEGDWFVRAAEDALIQNYNPLWQTSGFGSHVPGVGRPGTRVSRWDRDFPPR